MSILSEYKGKIKIKQSEQLLIQLLSRGKLWNLTTRKRPLIIHWGWPLTGNFIKNLKGIVKTAGIVSQ